MFHEKLISAFKALEYRLIKRSK